MNGKLRDAIEEFITQRMDDLGTDAPEAVEQTITAVAEQMDWLGAALAGEQAVVFRELENAMNEQTGEEMRYYYRAGFHDAIQFLLGWGESI